MIVGKIYPSSGCGDQLFRYITTRTLALDKGLDFGFIGKENFKGKDFMQLDWGKEVEGEFIVFNEKSVRDKTGIDISSYDPEINFVEDNTIIDGNFEDFKYWGHRLDEIREWLNTKYPKKDFNDDICVLNYRGGEFKSVPELYLPKEYWIEAMNKMVEQYPYIKFQCHTDDAKEARAVFGEKAVIFSNIELNWLAVRYAKHLILSNSAFGIIPALLNEKAQEIIAPRYHARRNIKVWARPACYYKRFLYI